MFRFEVIRRDCALAFYFGPTLLDLVTAWARRLAETPPVQPVHVGAQALPEHLPIRSLRPGCLGEPPHVLDRILDPDFAHGDPLRGHRHLGWIIPEALLGQ